jgi:hypothetical protein
LLKRLNFTSAGDKCVTSFPNLFGPTSPPNTHHCHQLKKRISGFSRVRVRSQINRKASRSWLGSLLLLFLPFNEIFLISTQPERPFLI